MAKALILPFFVLFYGGLLFSCANDIFDHMDADEDVVDCIADRD
jgi:hypothetical protein